MSVEKDERNKINSVLITRTDNIGDVILTLPLIHAAKQAFPQARIYFAVKEIIAPLLEKNLPDVETVLISENDTYSDKSEKLKHLKPDLVIFAKPEFDLALMQFLLNTKHRAGTAYRWYSFLFTDKIREHRKIADKHESVYNINLLRNVLREEFTPVLPGKYLNAGNDEREELRIKLIKSGLNINDRYIIIHPGSRGSARDITSEQFREIAGNILKLFPELKIVYTGTKNETNVVREAMPENDKNRVTDLCGQLSLRELMILIDGSELFISNSTGPAHIAGALGRNVICFFPNSAPMNSTRWKPLGKNTFAMSPPGGSDDMSLITAGEVTDLAQDIIGATK